MIYHESNLSIKTTENHQNVGSPIFVFFDLWFHVTYMYIFILALIPAKCYFVFTLQHYFRDVRDYFNEVFRTIDRFRKSKQNIIYLSYRISEINVLHWIARSRDSEIYLITSEVDLKTSYIVDKIIHYILSAGNLVLKKYSQTLIQ